jgi:hypothetical protein
VRIKENIQLSFIDPPFSAGTDAKWSGGFVETAPDKDWRVPDESIINAVFALPYEWAELQEKKVKKHYSKAWKVASKKRELNFLCHASVGKQAVLALLHNAYNHKNGTVDRSMFKRAIVLDAGGFSFDLVDVVDNKGVEENSGSEKKLGCLSVAADLKAEIKAREGYAATDKQVIDAIEHRQFYLETWLKWVPAFIESRYRVLSGLMLSYARSKADIDTCPVKLLTGGTSKHVAGYLQHDMNGLVVGKNPLFSNGIGALIMAMQVTKPGILPVGIDIGYSNTKMVMFSGRSLVGVVFPSFAGKPVRGGKLYE